MVSVGSGKAPDSSQTEMGQRQWSQQEKKLTTPAHMLLFLKKIKPSLPLCKDSWGINEASTCYLKFEWGNQWMVSWTDSSQRNLSILGSLRKQRKQSLQLLTHDRFNSLHLLMQLESMSWKLKHLLELKAPIISRSFVNGLITPFNSEQHSNVY